MVKGWFGDGKGYYSTLLQLLRTYVPSSSVYIHSDSIFLFIGKASEMNFYFKRIIPKGF